jgi:hypothetical protein
MPVVSNDLDPLFRATSFFLELVALFRSTGYFLTSIEAPIRDTTRFERRSDAGDGG